MITLFRKARIQSIADGRTGRYIRYAVGEIFLVVIGILIAVQVNTWNQNRLERKTVSEYYTKLLAETREVKSALNYMHNALDSLSNLQRRALKIVNERDHSRIKEFQDCVGAFATSWTNDLYTPIYDEFQRQNLTSKVKDDELKRLLTNFSTGLGMLEVNNDFIHKQYNTLIEPYFSKHFNYSVNALPIYRDDLIQGGPETDYSALFNSMEFWNIATLKLETTAGTKYYLDGLSSITDSLILELEQEITLD